jgi:hypothetical protein
MEVSSKKNNPVNLWPNNKHPSFVTYLLTNFLTIWVLETLSNFSSLFFGKDITTVSHHSTSFSHVFVNNVEKIYKNDYPWLIEYLVNNGKTYIT